jgi:hypothetical protein
MCASAANGTIPAMTDTRTSPKLVLATDRRAVAPGGARTIRRYRLARLRLAGRTAGWTIRSEPGERG